MKAKLLLFAAVWAFVITGCKKSDSTKTITYPTTGLVSYFPLDNNLTDKQGASGDGVNTGSATFETGIHGSAITLNGTNQKIVFPRKTFKSGNNVSVSFWFKTTDPHFRYFVYCSDFGCWSDSITAGMAINLPSTNSAEGSFTRGSWTHFVGTYDGTNIKLYLNGTLVDTVSHPGSIADADTDLTLGFFNSEFWAGSIDELFIYSRVLDQSDVTELYNAH